MTTRIHIAGPITGHPDHKVAFARAAEAIRRGRFPRGSVRLAERLLTMHRRTCGSGL